MRYAVAPGTKANRHLSLALLEKQFQWSWHIRKCTLNRRPLKISLFLILKRRKENTLTCISLFSYVRENNLSWKGPLEVTWSNPLLKARPIVKIPEVAQRHITKVLKGWSVQKFSEQPIAMFDHCHKDFFFFLRDGCQRLSKDKYVLV